MCYLLFSLSKNHSEWRFAYRIHQPSGFINLKLCYNEKSLLFQLIAFKTNDVKPFIINYSFIIKKTTKLNAGCVNYLIILLNF